MSLQRKDFPTAGGAGQGGASRCGRQRALRGTMFGALLGPERKMGSAMLPTPLSPAVGPEGRLSPDVSRASCLGSGAMSPGARAGAGSGGCEVRSEDCDLALGSSETDRRYRVPGGLLDPKIVVSIEIGPVRPVLPTARPPGFNAWGIDRSGDLSFPFAPPRGISRSSQVRFQNLFFFQGVTPSIRRANPRSR